MGEHISRDRLVPSSGPDRLLYLLKQTGPADAESLASELEVSGAAVRQHLYQLRDQGLVASRSERRPMGRPAKIWELTPAASVRLPQAGSPIVDSLLRSTQETLGVAGMQTAVCGCVEDQVERYRHELKGKRSLKAKLKALVDLRNEDGFMAELAAEPGGGFTLYENHCPIASAVANCSQLCDAELLIFEQILSQEAKIIRLEHMEAGDRRCSYGIIPKR